MEDFFLNSSPDTDYTSPDLETRSSVNPTVDAPHSNPIEETDVLSLSPEQEEALKDFENHVMDRQPFYWTAEYFRKMYPILFDRVRMDNILPILSDRLLFTYQVAGSLSLIHKNLAAKVILTPELISLNPSLVESIKARTTEEEELINIFRSLGYPVEPGDLGFITYISQLRYLTLRQQFSNDLADRLEHDKIEIKYIMYAISFLTEADSTERRILKEYILVLYKGYLEKVVHRYRRYKMFDDLLQEAELAFYDNLEKYDPFHGMDLWTYMRQWVRAGVNEYIARNNSVVYIQDRFIRRVERKKNEGGTLDSHPEVVASYGSRVCVSTEIRVGREKGRTLGSTLQSDKLYEYDEEQYRRTLVREKLADLEAKIIVLREKTSKKAKLNTLATAKALFYIYARYELFSSKEEYERIKELIPDGPHSSSIWTYEEYESLRSNQGGVSLKEIGKAFGVSHQSINQVLTKYVGSLLIGRKNPQIGLLQAYFTVEETKYISRQP